MRAHTALLTRVLGLGRTNVRLRPAIAPTPSGAISGASAVQSASCLIGLALTRTSDRPAGHRCLSCRWFDGAVRQQCAGHLPFERQATVNSGFPILPTGTTD